MFQGGFVGQNGTLEVGFTLETLQRAADLDCFEDSNDFQDAVLEKPSTGRFLKINFNSSTDFYGRVTVYSLEVRGVVEDPPAVLEEVTSVKAMESDPAWTRRDCAAWSF